MVHELYALEICKILGRRHITKKLSGPFVLYYGSLKKSSFFSGPTTERGGVGPLRKKGLFFNIFFYLWPWKKFPNDH